MTTTELRRLWNEKVTRDVPLTKEEKDAFVSAYWDGTLPRIEGINQWVEDGCKSFDALDGRGG